MKRVLAIAPAPRGFGYAVLEGPDFLVDWGLKGTSRLRGRNHAWCVRQAERLVEVYLPEVVTLDDYKASHFRRGRDVREFLARTNERAVLFGARVRLVPRRLLGQMVENETSATKYRIALAVARRFPELAWRLPPVRKPWMSEDARMAMFGAVALALAYYGKRREQSAAACSANSDGRIVSALKGVETTPSMSKRR
jgi:hypothetical protein